MKKPEHLGSVPINAGTAKGKEFGGNMVRGKFVPNATADMVREVDPTGAIVSHPVRRSAYVHERLHSMSGRKSLRMNCTTRPRSSGWTSNGRACPATMPEWTYSKPEAASRK